MSPAPGYLDKLDLLSGNIHTQIDKTTLPNSKEMRKYTEQEHGYSVEQVVLCLKMKSASSIPDNVKQALLRNYRWIDGDAE